MVAKQYGCCSHCGERCFSEEGKQIKPYKSVPFRAEQGVQMMFILCKNCMKTQLDFSKMEEFMRQGWEEELSQSDRSEEDKQEYRDMFFGLKIKERI